MVWEYIGSINYDQSKKRQKRRHLVKFEKGKYR